MYFRQIIDRASASLCYLIADRSSGDALVVDPLPSHALLLLAIIEEQGLNLRYVLRTHVHPPMQGAFGLLWRVPGVRHGLGAEARGVEADLHFEDGDELALGAEALQVIATPGHTPGCVSYLWRDRLLCGDLMEINGCGQPVDETDWGVMYDSVTRKVLALPDETLLFPAHDYRGRTVSTVAEERRMNIAFAGKSREGFISSMRASPRVVVRHAVGSPERPINCSGVADAEMALEAPALLNKDSRP